MDGTHLELALREPGPAEWSRILDLANRSVRGVPGAGSQEEWLRNRQRPHELRRHLLALESGRIVGYGALEARFGEAPGRFRLFLVAPDRLRSVGEILHRRMMACLTSLGAREAFFVEYAADASFIVFLRDHGYREMRQFRLAGGVECAVLSKRLYGA